ncbi:MAG TPA: pilus assembly protein TadG-related protein [Candidatus Baltobacteraceae bacterium]|nr:pilus assembly protein TadG-related protein [Candidatus Baltobacteraceae bacterium]
MNGFQAQRGQVLPFVALMIGVLLAVAGLAVDVGFHQYQQRLQQTAADSAALAGAAEYLATSYNSTDAIAAARADAASNGFANGGNNTVTVNVPPAAGDAYSSDSGAVQVIITVQQPTFFEPIVGKSSVNVTTSAVATSNAGTENGCIYSLGASANTNFNKDAVTAANCDILINGTANFNQASITAAAVDCVSSTACSGLNSPVPTVGLPVSDPCPQIAGCAYLTNNPPAANGCSSVSVADGGTVGPGCYNSLTFSGTTATMSPGLYIINGSNFNGPNGVTITGTGVTIYVTSTGSMDFNKMTLNLSACTTTCTNNAVSNVLFYQVKSNTSNPNFNKITGTTFTGLVYFPSVDVNMNKDFGSGYTVMVFDSVNMNQGTYTFPGGGAGGSIIKRTAIVE